MRFIVHGVDRTTGQETKLPLDAAGAAQAESIASLSMLVAEVEVDPTPVQSVPYAQPDTNAGGFDWPSGILRQARVLRALSWAVAAVGALGIVYVPVARFAVAVDSSVLNEALGLLHLISASDIGNSLYLLVVACLMRLAAHFMLGLRELLLRKIDRDN